MTNTGDSFSDYVIPPKMQILSLIPRWRVKITLLSALFWVIMQRIVVIPCRPIGTAYQFHRQRSRVLVDGPETSVRNRHYMCVITQKNADSLYFAVEASNHTSITFYHYKSQRALITKCHFRFYFSENKLKYCSVCSVVLRAGMAQSV